jgi:monooxygenase
MLRIENAEGNRLKPGWLISCLGCTGYYNYDQGFQPDFPNKAGI